MPRSGPPRAGSSGSTHDESRKHHREPEGADLALKAAIGPGIVQSAFSRVLAHPRTYNLVVSNIPGPPVPMYMLGCRLESVYPWSPCRTATACRSA